MKNQIRLYLQLMRFDKPIGRILLAWPCLWGIAHSYHASNAPISSCLVYSALLIAGAFIMSAFGCIINDIADKEFDKHVERTKMRPLAAKILTIKQALGCACILGTLALGIFTLLPIQAKLYAGIGTVLLFIYPYMKRISYYPQVILGLAFNTGILVGYACLSGAPTERVWWLYGCGALWTIAYDTIYAFQDIKDDKKIGIKSTAIRFEKYPNIMVGTCYALGFICLYFSKSQVSTALIMYAIFAIYTIFMWYPKDITSSLSFFKKHAFFSIFGIFP
ncbi:MAG: 4-hydroxybenzoate octaprenyltransferase [Candidatus Paracaedibacteraceae bacterium]|nr:4-hydroxybenzoate octaprenyltransferase [Candidatus Paracaedibacteraceae bacterium]